MSTPTQQLSVWKMNKTQLMSEAMRLHLTVHPTWSVGELRQMVSDSRRAGEETSQVPRGLASMTLEQLKEQATEFRLTIPPTPTKGQLRLMIRDAATHRKGDAVVTFGRHKNKLFKEVPLAYLEWAMKEVQERGQESSGADLVSLAMYAKAKLMPEETAVYDPEINPRVPLPEESSSSSVWESHWSEVSENNRQMIVKAGYREEQAKAEEFGSPSTEKLKRRSATTGSRDNAKKMDQEVPDEVREEINELMTRLAALKDKHGL